MYDMPVIHKKESPNFLELSSVKVAMTYSPTNVCSTIGAVGLNFSVRNGKRWIPDAINRLNICRKTMTMYRKKDRTHYTTVNNKHQTSIKKESGAGCEVCFKAIGAADYQSRADRSFRAISTARLNTSLCVHLQPINVVVYNDPHEEI